VNESDETVTFARFAGPEPSRNLAADEAAVDPAAASGVPGVVSLAFMGAAIRRRSRFCLILALIGLVVGAYIYHAKEGPVKAQSTLYIQYNINAENGDGGPDAIATDQSLFQSLAVAEATVKKLGLNESAATFAGRYLVTVVTNQVVTIQLTAPSASDAVRWLNALDAECLAFRAKFLTVQQQQMVTTLNQSVAAAKAGVTKVTAQISQLAGTRGPGVAKQLSQLRTKRSALNSKLGALEQNVQSSEVSGQVLTLANIKGGYVLDAAALMHRSRFKLIGEFLAAGLGIGLTLGIGIVIVQAVVSTKLRRRYDVAQALAAPVRLSIGKVKASAVGRGGRASADPGIRLVVRHLRDVRASLPPPAALAVVPADRPEVAAVSLVSLARSQAQKGLDVVVADLAGGAAARLLNVSTPGLHKVDAAGASLSVYLAHPATIGPRGPLGRGPSADPEAADPDPSADPDAPGAELIAAVGSADRILTLAVLDPAIGADYLATWASAAVVIVTAGVSTAVRLRATADMIRLAGVYLASAVLIGADKSDESLGNAELPLSVSAADAELLNLSSL